MLIPLGMDIIGSLVRQLGAALRHERRRPRLVRRTTIHCPVTGRAIEVDLLMDCTATPALVLRCAQRPEHPPTCPQACRMLAEAAAAPAQALLILPPGTDVPDEID